MKWQNFCCSLLIVTQGSTAFSAPVSAAEADLLFRTGTPATEVAMEILTRGLSEPLSPALKAKFTAGGVTADVVQRMQKTAPTTASVRAPAIPSQPMAAELKSQSSSVRWPKVGEPYPSLILPDPDGRPVNLAAYRGKVLLIEPIGMPCAACQAFSGGDEVGEFNTTGSHGVQKNLGSLESLFDRFAPGVELEDDRIVYIQLLLYGSHTAAPTLEQARKWRAHFSPAWKRKQPIILVGTPGMIGPETYALIPGFQLVDQNFVLRYDAAGHRPKHNIYEQLLPAIPQMLSR